MSESWRIGPFIPVEREVLADLPDVRFSCPVSGIDVAWAAKDAFNPGAAVHERRVHMLFRGEDTVWPLRWHLPDRSGRERRRADVRGPPTTCSVPGRRPLASLGVAWRLRTPG